MANDTEFLFRHTAKPASLRLGFALPDKPSVALKAAFIEIAAETRIAWQKALEENEWHDPVELSEETKDIVAEFVKKRQKKLASLVKLR